MPTNQPIISITPNPALDLGGIVEHLTPDEKNYVHDETRFPGGNALNAARIIRRLDFPVEVSGFLGGGVGTEIRGLIEGEGLKHSFIPIKGSTRISVTVSNVSSHHQTRLSYSGPTISKDESDKLHAYVNDILPGSLVLFGGSFPPGFTAKHLSELLRTLSKKHCECVVDIPGPLLKEVCAAETTPLLIKPNLTEFQQLLGNEVTSTESVLASARPLVDKIPLVCVSSVNGGALLLTSQSSWFGRIPDVMVKTSVGAGDSMVGAMCTVLNQWNFETRRDPKFSALVEANGETLLRWGLAAACATLTVHGTQLGNAKEIRQFVDQIRIERL